jgi:hypothetical protein
MLKQEWKKSQDFTQERIKSIAERLGLPNRKVYKWVWDRKKEQNQQFYR